MDRTPLDVPRLSAAAQRALGAGPGRMMAARGLMPLPPADQVCVLYQLALDTDTTLASTARATAANLPDKVLAGALADAKLDPRVLDLFAALAGKRPAVFDALVQNPAIADDTIAVLAEHGGARECELIATNEQRLLRQPAIIGALYQNKQARMSTVDRAVELAVRNNVRVPGLAAWDEIARALQGAPPVTPADDELFARERFDDGELGDDEANDPRKDDDKYKDEDFPWGEIPMKVKIRMAATGSAKRRMEALRDPKSSLAMIAVKSQKRFKDSEIEKIASSHVVNDDVIRHIAGNSEFTKAYSVKIALCRNPKTPIANAANLLMHLHERELNAIATSRNIPSAMSVEP